MTDYCFNRNPRRGVSRIPPQLYTVMDTGAPEDSDASLQTTMLRLTVKLG